MRRRKQQQLTPLELEIMHALWELGSAPVQAVQQALAEGGNKLAYTTVQTMLNVLWRKQKVKRTMVERAFWYEAAVSRQRALATALNDVVTRLFGGSAEALVLSLMETKQITPQTLKKLQEMLEEEEKPRE